MALTIGELTAYLTVDDEQFTKGVQGATSDLKHMGRTAESSSSMTSSAMTAVGRSTGKASSSVSELGRSSTRSANKLSRFGDVGDAVDTRAMGFRDTLTGVSDSMAGVASVASGSLTEGLLLVGMGIGDLGSAVYNGLVPALSAGRDKFAELRTSGSKTRTTLGKVGKAAGAVGLALGGLVAAGHAAAAMFGEDFEVDIGAARKSLDKFVGTSKATGELLHILGGDLQQLGDKIDYATQFGWQFWNWAEEMTGLDAFESVAKARDRFAALDKALAQLAAGSPQRARRALHMLAQKAGLSQEQVKKLKNVLPKYQAAQQNANKATAAATRKLNAQVKAIKRATSPVFNLISSLRQVDQAQDAYNKAVEKYTKDSPQARTASIKLAQAVAGAEVAAHNAKLDYDAFDRKLSQWVDTGRITAGTADLIRQQVNEARGEAEAYRGNYDASLTLHDYASQAISNISGGLAGIYQQLLDINNTPIAPGGSTSPGGPPLPLGSITGGRASGGPVMPGNTYWVGEKGPELFRTSTPGRIVPHEQSVSMASQARVAPAPAPAPTVGPRELREALAGVELRVDESSGRVMAKIVNRVNASNARR